jgi:divalent metal cation (Fe/Co/Zn/Cd) transporter
MSVDAIDSSTTVESAVAASIVRLQWITIAWMCMELFVAASAGVRACSIALTAFAGDSAIELFSGVVVLRRFRIGIGAEKSAARMTAVLLYLLAAYILVSSSVALLSNRLEAKPSYAGIGLLIAAAIIMPLLGRAKKRLAFETGSDALKADATQSSVCAYMSWIALAGLGINAVFHLPWADSVAALLLIPLVVKEANDARRGKACC